MCVCVCAFLLGTRPSVFLWVQWVEWNTHESLPAMLTQAPGPSYKHLRFWVTSVTYRRWDQRDLMGHCFQPAGVTASRVALLREWPSFILMLPEFSLFITPDGKLFHYLVQLQVKNPCLIFSLRLIMDSFYQFVLVSILEVPLLPPWCLPNETNCSAAVIYVHLQLWVPGVDIHM